MKKSWKGLVKRVALPCWNRTWHCRNVVTWQCWNAVSTHSLSDRTWLHKPKLEAILVAVGESVGAKGQTKACFGRVCEWPRCRYQWISGSLFATVVYRVCECSGGSSSESLPITVIVSPLVSIMKDQAMDFNQRGLPSNYLHCIITWSGWRLAVLQGKLCPVCTSLEACGEILRSDVYQERLLGFAADEAYCIKKWYIDYVLLVLISDPLLGLAWYYFIIHYSTFISFMLTH